MPFNKGFSIPFEYLLRKNLHQTLDNIKSSQKYLKSDSLKNKISKDMEWFQKKATGNYIKGCNTNNGIQRKEYTNNFHIKQHQGHQLYYYRKYQVKSTYKSTFKSKYGQYQWNSLPITRKTVHNFRGQNIKQYLVQRKNIISNQFIHNFQEKILKLVLINTPKLNLKFLFHLSVEEKDISRNEETFKDESYIQSKYQEWKKSCIRSIYQVKKWWFKKITFNLKIFNKIIGYKPFKTESLQSVFELIRPRAYMASINRKEAIYLVPVHENQ